MVGQAPFAESAKLDREFINAEIQLDGCRGDCRLVEGYE